MPWMFFTAARRRIERPGSEGFPYWQWQVGGTATARTGKSTAAKCTAAPEKRPSPFWGVRISARERAEACPDALRILDKSVPNGESAVLAIADLSVFSRMHMLF